MSTLPPIRIRPWPPRHSLLLLTLLILSLTLLYMCLSFPSRPSEPPISVVVLTFSPAAGTHPTIHYVTDKSQITRLESFFPNYRARPASNIAGAWIAGHEVYFNFLNGQTIRITVSENQNAASWTAGQGDFETHGDFNAFLTSLPR